MIKIKAILDKVRPASKKENLQSKTDINEEEQVIKITSDDPFSDLPERVRGLVNQKLVMKNYTVSEKIKHQQAFLTDLAYPKKWNHSQFVRDAINKELKTMTHIDWPESIDPNRE